MLSGEDIEVCIFSFLLAGSILASSSVIEARFLEARSSEVFTLLISSCSMKSECSFVTFLPSFKCSVYLFDSGSSVLSSSFKHEIETALPNFQIFNIS